MKKAFIDYSKYSKTLGSHRLLTMRPTVVLLFSTDDAETLNELDLILPAIASMVAG